MRGALITTADYYYGPDSPYGPPGVQYLSGVPCRLVLQQQIQQRDFPLTLTNYWMTCDGPLPNSPDYHSYELGEWHAKVSTSDQVAIPSGTAPRWYAIRHEEVLPLVRVPYVRTLLLPLDSVRYPLWLPPSPPPPVTLPIPGATCGMASMLADDVPSFWQLGPGGSEFWLRFARPGSGVMWLSTCGFTSFVGHQVYTGSDCSSLTGHGLVLVDGYNMYSSAVGEDFFVKMNQSVGGAPKVALRASSFHS